MIKLRLKFANKDGRDFEIIEGELLNDAVKRVLEDTKISKLNLHEHFNAVVNGHNIDGDFWTTVALKESDVVVVSPKIKSGDAGQIFKTAAIIAITIIASVYLGPEAGEGVWATLGAGLEVAAVTIGATLLLNALIPPPVASNDLGVNGGLDSSQMYAISGQSNQAKPLQTVPKVYGLFRMFPNVAAQPYMELATDPDTGETIQYMYVIYDFGLGTYKVSDLQIGDTPLTTDSFADFKYNLVDPTIVTPADQYDQQFSSEFQYYKSRREQTSLSIALNNDGDQNVQFTDPNVDNLPQEIILGFVCPTGLFGFSSDGTLGSRNILLSVEFAPVGTNDWHAFNDLNFVNTFTAVGGADTNSFSVSVVPTFQQGSPDQSNDEFYFLVYNIDISITWAFIKPNSTKLLLPTGAYAVGGQVFNGSRFLGNIISVDTVSKAPNVVVTLDRPMTTVFDMWAYKLDAFGDPPRDITVLTVVSASSGAAVVTGKSTSPVYSTIRFTPKQQGQFQVRVTRVKAYGDWTAQISDKITWGGLSTGYSDSPVKTNKRHTFLELKIRATDQLNGNITTLSAICSSIIPIYDPVTQTWNRGPTSNPAWVFVDLLCGEVNKKAISHDRLHMDSLVEWAEFCDEVPTPPPGQTFTQPRFSCNFILDYQTTLQDVLAQVGGSAQASLNIIDGKYGVLVDKQRTTPVQIFTPRNSSGFSSTRSYAPRPDGVNVTFIDPNGNWSTSQIAAYDNGFNVGNAVNLDELTAFACTNHEQAWRFGRYMIAQNRLRQETITLIVDFEYLACTRGDYVQITQDVMKVGGTPARVKAVAGNVITTDDSLDINPALSYGYTCRSNDGTIFTSTLTPLTPNTFAVDGAVPVVGNLIVVGIVGQIVFDCIVKAISPNDDTSANLTLVEKADGIYSYESSSELPDYTPQTSLVTDPNYFPPAAVTNLTISDNSWRCSPTRSGIDYYVDLSWDMPNGSVWELFEIFVNDGRGYKSVATTNLKTYRYFVDQSRLDIEYGFKVSAVSASGKKLELVAMTTVTATPSTKPIPPSDVKNFNVTITDLVIQLTWDKIDDCDAFQYVLRYSPDPSASEWQFSTPLAIVSSAFNTFSCQARTGTYFIKAIDYAGNQSANPGIAITTVPKLYGLNDIESIDEAPAFGGERDQTVLFGEAVVLDEQVPGDIDNVVYYSQGYYTFENLLDLGDIYSVRLLSLLQADGFKKGETMADWVHLSDVDHLNTTTHDDWGIALQYRTTNEFNSMADWVHLSLVDHLNFGAGAGFTDWRDIPMVGDVTGRLFQFRIRLDSFKPNVTPRVYDTTVEAVMPDRLESVNNIVSDIDQAVTVTYSSAFAGPDPTPTVQISIDAGETGDYWTFDSKTLEGFSIRFFDKNGVQVVRQFDAVAKGFGFKSSSVI